MLANSLVHAHRNRSVPEIGTVHNRGDGQSRSRAHGHIISVATRSAFADIREGQDVISPCKLGIKSIATHKGWGNKDMNQPVLSPRPDEVRDVFIVTALCLLIQIALQTTFIVTDLRPDEYKYIGAFNEFFFGTDAAGQVSTALVRLILLSICVVLSLVFYRLGLIDKNTLVLALVWPMTTFLFSRIHIEFLVFPFCLMALNARIWVDVAVILVLVGLGLFLRENNFFVIAIFRSIIVAQKVRFTWLAPSVFLAFAVSLNHLLNMGIAQRIPLLGPELQRFNWTRTVVNPEYNPLETLVVFFSSMHFFTRHDLAWYVDAVFTAMVLAVLAADPESRRRLFKVRHYVFAFAVTLIGMGEITHAFQNARYYFFFIPLLAVMLTRRNFIAIALLGLAHTAIKSVEAAIY
ncbi:hypothetical protein [Maricaulis salignorans]|nr:hypothetical protein [Maricaulis salignorans]